MSRRTRLLVAACLCAAAPVHAQEYPCWNNRGFVDRNPDSPTVGRVVAVPDPQSSFTWNQLAGRNDPRAAQALAGTWVTRYVSPQDGRVQDYYASFEANGLFQYRDQTCGGPMDICSRNQGAGEFRAAFQDDGSIFS